MSTRTKLPDRRPNVTLKIQWQQASGASRDVLVTMGRDARDRIVEVFTADFKAGSDHVGIVTDTCILISQLLQRGCTLDEMLGSICEPPSLIGAIIKAMAAEQDN